MRTIRWIIIGYFNLVVSKLKMLSKKRRELYEKRYTACQSCEHLRIDLWEYCEICGCYVKAKTKVDEATCPKGYW